MNTYFQEVDNLFQVAAHVTVSVPDFVPLANVFVLDGGILAWKDQIDATLDLD